MRRDEFLATAARIADIGLIVGGLLASLVFLHFFYQYGWMGQRQFTGSRYIVLYYVCPLALAVLLFAALRFSPAHRVNLFILCFTSFMSAYALELFAEARYASGYSLTRPVMVLLEDSNHKKRDAAALTEKWGVEIDTRSAAEVLAALRTGGVDPVPILTPSNHLFIRQPDGSIKSAIHVSGQEVMPLAGVSNRLTLLCNENGEWIHYQSDWRGFNNSNDIWRSEPLQIAALGDSFTHGYCVPAEKNFLALIRSRYPLTLNLGVAGDGPLLMLATLEEYLPHFKPPIVLWFYFEENDLEDLQNERKSPLLMHYLNEGFRQSALVRQNEIDLAMLDEIPRLTALEQTRRTNRLHNSVTGKIGTFTRLEVLRASLGLVGGMDADAAEAAADMRGPDMEVFRLVLAQAKLRISAWGGELIFVYLPDWSRYAGYPSSGKETRGDVLAVVRNLGIPVIDIHGAFQAHGDPLSLFPFRRSGHYNEIGHRLVASEVLKVLSQKHQPL